METVLRASLLLVIFSLVLPQGAVAQTPSAVYFIKTHGYQQTTATAITDYQPSFGISVQFATNVASAVQVTVQGPGVNYTLSRDSSSGSSSSSSFTA